MGLATFAHAQMFIRWKKGHELWPSRRLQQTVPIINLLEVLHETQNFPTSKYLAITEATDRDTDGPWVRRQ